MTNRPLNSPIAGIIGISKIVGTALKTYAPFVLKFSAPMSILRPILEHIVCPSLKEFDNGVLDSVCSTTVTATTVIPPVVGLVYGGYGIVQQHSLKSFCSSVFKLGKELVLPAGLSMVTAQATLRDHDIPPISFIIGTVKSSLDIATIRAIAETFELKNSIMYTGYIAANVASVTNFIYYIGNGVINSGEKFSSQMLSDASDYSLGFTIARPLYETGQYFLLVKEMPLASSAFYFVAPVSRGLALGALEKGSVTVPGSNDGIASNVLDGVAIALGSILTKKCGYLPVDILMGAILIAHHSNITDSKIGNLCGYADNSITEIMSGFHTNTTLLEEMCMRDHVTDL